MTHWEPLGEPGEHFGVNLRNFDAAVVSMVPVRKFDGADTWTFVE